LTNLEYLYKNINTLGEQDLLEQLRTLTANVPSYNKFFYDENRVMNLECVEGSAYTIGIYSDINASIAKTTFEKGTIISPHFHPEIEVIMILSGEMHLGICTDDDVLVKTYKQHSIAEISPLKKHSAKFIEKTIAIVVTMPMSVNFPKP